jgi:hypothetical protein
MSSDLNLAGICGVGFRCDVMSHCDWLVVLVACGLLYFLSDLRHFDVFWFLLTILRFYCYYLQANGRYLLVDYLF